MTYILQGLYHDGAKYWNSTASYIELIGIIAQLHADNTINMNTLTINTEA